MRTFRLRPSAAGTWVRCAGHVRLSADVPEYQEDDSVEIREAGTACHWAAHAVSQGAPIASLIGQTAPNGVEIDDEMADAVDLYLGAVAAWPTAARRYYEYLLHCRAIHDECGGTPDVFAWDAETRTIFIGDLKYGFRFISAEANYQLICYIFGVMWFFKLRPEDVQHVHLMICQPRNPTGGGPIRDWRATMVDIEPYLHQLQAAALLALSDDAQCMTNAGCRSCAAASACPALADAAAGVLDACHRATPHDLPFAQAEQELHLLTWAEGIVQARREALEQQVMHQIKRGALSRCYRLEQGYTRLQWNTGSAEKVRALARVMGVSLEKPVQLITPTQAKKIIGEPLVNEFAQRLPSAVKLVPTDAAKWRRIFGAK